MRLLCMEVRDSILQYPLTRKQEKNVVLHVKELKLLGLYEKCTPPRYAFHKNREPKSEE